jgi:hypothetical protein
MALPEPDTGDGVVAVVTEHAHAAESVLAQSLDTLVHTYSN